MKSNSLDQSLFEIYKIAIGMHTLEEQKDINDYIGLTGKYPDLTIRQSGEKKISLTFTVPEVENA